MSRPALPGQRLRRMPSLEKEQVSPRSIMVLGKGLPAAGNGDHPRTIVLDKGMPTRLLIGRARLEKHNRFLSDSPISAFRVEPRSEDDADAISELDGWSTLSQYAAGLAALQLAGMPLSQIKEVVHGAGHISDLSRTIAIFNESPFLFDLADSSRGALTLSHLLLLGRADSHVREELARAVIAKPISVRDLRTKILRPSTLVDPDIGVLARELGQALNTEVEVTGDSETGEVRIAWTGVEDLQGVFQRLGKHGTDGGPLPSPASSKEPRVKVTTRWLSIHYASHHEFDDLFSHLLGADSGFGPQGVRD